MKVTGILYSFVGIIFFLQCIFVVTSGQEKLSFETLAGCLAVTLLFGVLGLRLLKNAKKLKTLSYRPYWQINKYLLTGKREAEEEKYIKIGNRHTRLVKQTWGVMKVFFRLLVQFG
jgi:hypothetical protein